MTTQAKSLKMYVILYVIDRTHACYLNGPFILTEKYWHTNWHQTFHGISQLHLGICATS